MDLEQNLTFGNFSETPQSNKQLDLFSPLFPILPAFSRHWVGLRTEVKDQKYNQEGFPYPTTVCARNREAFTILRIMGRVR